MLTRQGRAVPHRLSGARAQSDPARRCRRWRSWPPSSGIAGNEYFPPTSFQISNIHAGTGANNIDPGRAGGAVQLPFFAGVDGRGTEGARPRACSIATASTTTWSGRCRRSRFSRRARPAGRCAQRGGQRGHRRHAGALDQRRHVGRPLPRGDRRARSSSSGRSASRSTGSTSTCGSPTSRRCR